MVEKTYDERLEKESICKCKETSCNNDYIKESQNYFKERQRQYEIMELLKSKFGFKEVKIGRTDKTEYIIDATYNGESWVVLKTFANYIDFEIIEFFQHAIINNKWDDRYTFSPHSIVLQNIVDSYGLGDIDYCQKRNKFCRLNHDNNSIDEIVDTTVNLKGISLNFDDENYITSLAIATKDGKYIITDEDGVTFERNK